MDPYFQSYLDFKYFQNIFLNLRYIKLNAIQEQFLYIFVYHPHSSAYDIASGKKLLDVSRLLINKIPITYRHAKIVIKFLYKLKLIDYDKEKEKNSHQRQPYSLTYLGLFYLIRSPNFLSIDIQAMIKNYPNLKIFMDLLYPFIKLETLSFPDIPLRIKNQISLYIQEQYLKIENFISSTENKEDWNLIRWIWNEEKLQRYLINKYKYEWLETADTEISHEGTIVKFVNKNKTNEQLEIRLRANKNSGYLIIGPEKKKKKKEITANIKKLLLKFSFSKEEEIGNIFSTYYYPRCPEFVFSIVSSFNDFNFDTLLLFSKDENFIRSLETAKEEFEKNYLSIKNPYQYSAEARLAKNFWEISLAREIKIIHDKSTS